MMKHVEECYVLSKPCRYDLFKHMSASENFAIDLDSLILHAMMNANVQLQGIQVLHVCFNVESYLHNFRARGAHFQLVVFESNKWIWNRFPQLALTRVAILAHIAKCGHSIIRFANWWDTNSSSFKQHCVKSGVEFILFSDSEQLPMSLILLGESETIMQEISSLLRTCALFFVSSCATSVVFTTRLIFRDSGAVGFVWNRVPDNFSNELFDTELKHIRTLSSTRLQELSSDQQIAPVGDDKNLTSFRMCAAAAAAQDLLTRKGTSNIEHVKLFLLHIGLLEVLTLEQRCFKGEISSDAESLAFVDDICASMALYIYQEEKKEESLMDGTVTDCFDGRLLLKLIELKNKNKWPSFTSKIKEVTIHLWRSVPALLGSQEWNFPEGGACVEECSPFDIEDADISPAVDMDSSPIAAWLPRSSTMSTVLDKHYLPFYENIAINRVNFFKRVHDDAATLGEKPYPLVSDHDITMIGNRSHVKGTERNIMIGNTMERVKQDITKRKDRTENIRKEFNLKPFHHSLKAMMDLITECQSAARHYREEINRIHRTTKENKDKGHKDHWTTSNPGKSDDKNSESELPPDILSLMQVTNFSYLDVIMDSYLYLLQEIMQRWASEVEKATAAGRKRNLHQATSAFLIIHKARGVLEESAHFITPEESKKIKKWLRDLRDTLSVLGLRDNVRVWEEYWKSLNLSLPTPSLFIPEKPIYSVGMTSIRFQMTAMGDRLERATSVPDRRLPFTPDLWQKKLADIIDARQSAVVCTPTSAGKTFASLYCIKTTLMEDPVPEEPGIVVYVAPTKSLLRQALASIYTQFINKKYESTWNVYGVLEDYAFMIERCQALVTIPQAFELLMLSERLEHQKLIQRVRYVIFDEIHSIDDLQTGCIWERLLILIRAPFIALSATVGNPEALIDWTQSVQDIALQQFLADPSIPESTKTLDSSLSRFKVNRIPDVGEKIHRWSDLQKYIYCPLHNAEKFDGRTKVYNENGMLDADYCSDSLLSIHPMSILNLKWLQKEGFPQDFPFLPHEMLTFYDVMKRHVRKKVMPDAYHAVHESLDPEKYFSAKNRPILTQSLVRAFEADLIHEFMKWVEESKSNKDVRKVASAVLEELGSGKSFFIPQSSSKLFTAMSEAQEDEDSILDALYPMNAFRSDLDPKPNDLLLHQYLLCSYFVYWERCSLLNASSAHADRVKAVLRFFNVSSAESLPTPLGELITQIRQDNLPHRSQESLSTFRRGDIVPDYPGVDAEITEVYRQMNTVMQKVSSAPMDALFPSVFFERIQPDEGRLKQYKILLIQELHSWSPADRLRVHLPESMILIQNDLQANYVMAHLNQVDPENDIFLRLPIRMSKLKPKESLDYVEEVLPELLTALNSKQMLPALVFNLDISNVERLASSLCEFLEEKESNFRSGNDFQIMLKRVEDMKKQLASQAKTNASKTRSKKANDDEDGKRLKGDNRVQVEEISDLDSMVQEIPPILPYFSFARQGAGESSQKIQELITDFLGDPAFHNEATRMYIRCINRGIGIHHTGMNSRVMSLMEHLFRTRNIGVLFCTESLALGIHSPCRTVVFAGDSAKLTNVQFRQISGRAGRRGIDFLGHVVLLGLSSRKITRLFTSQLQILRGHTVMDPTIHLQTKSQNESITSAVECQKNLKKRRGTKFTAQNVSDHLVESVRGGIERLHVSSFLWNTLNFSTKKHIPLQNETWKQYTTRFLENEGFALKPELEAVLRGYSKSEGTNVATEDGVVIPMYCRIQTELLVRALHAYMNVRLNGLNFTFMALLRDGTLHKLAEEYCATELSDLTSDAFHAMELRKNKDLMVLLSALFQVDAFGLPLEIHPSLVHASVHSRHLDEYAVQLPALDPNSSSAIERYTQRVLHHYAQFAREVMQFLRTTCPDSVYALPYTGYVVQRAVSSPGKYDTTFRLSGTRKDVLARSPFVALCGKGDTFTCVEDFLLSMASCFYLDASVIPTVDFIDLHSRKGAGRVHLNACTYDFLRIGSQQIRSQIQRIHLRDFHGLSFDDSWMILSRVCSAIDAIYASTSFFTSSKIESSTSQEYGIGVELLKQEDSLVVALKHLSCCWRLRRPELGLREDSWLLSIQRAKQDSKKKTN